MASVDERGVQKERHVARLGTERQCEQLANLRAVCGEDARIGARRHRGRGRRSVTRIPAGVLRLLGAQHPQLPARRSFERRVQLADGLPC